MFANCTTGMDSRILFPKYSGGKVRISEQELRFIFVEQLLNPKLKTAEYNEIVKQWHYSVETPTHFKYRSAQNGNEPSIGRGRNSGKIDLTLYEDSNSDKPIVFIEFKHGNLSPKNREE